MNEFILEKFVWTENDFEVMGWHDSFVYGISISDNHEFLLDIDYIFKWINPITENGYFRFWICPCTLVFENVYSLRVDLEVAEPFEIQISDIEMFLHQDSTNVYDWNILTNQGNIYIKSTGFKQYVRRKPISTEQQCISPAERGVVSFFKGIEDN